MSDSNRRQWHIKTLIAAHLLALVLMASWLFEPGKSLWFALDSSSFWAMNDSLRWSEAWQTLWAIANNRAFDLVAAVSMLSLFAYRGLFGDRPNLNRYLAIGILMFIALVIALQLGKALPIERPSATAHFPEALRLSQLVPDIHTKDYSGDSFPGDHGLVLLMCTGFALRYLPLSYGILAIVFTPLFTLPRLMSGAHWLSDELVGAVALASVCLAWLFATPLAESTLNRLEPWVARQRQRIGL